jgi:uncharacterized protein YndB with AHSA1/START domain
MSTNTVRLHRVLRATPEKVYRTFLDPDAMAKWLPPHGFTARPRHGPAVGGTRCPSRTWHASHLWRVFELCRTSASAH